MSKKVLMIDHYDSFTYNLVQQIQGLGAEVVVYAHDRIEMKEINFQEFSHIVLSPGPGHPKNESDFKISKQIIELIKNRTLTQPLLGVCLGHQGIAYVWGAEIIKAPKIMHGKVSDLHHSGTGLFQGIDQGMQVMRYHSWVVDPKYFEQNNDALSLQNPLNALKTTATSIDDQCIMAFEHHQYPIYGIQFHPESIATPLGYVLMQNFLNML
jgi:anthranilate synthase/aminodeoxychorismate synthase-like glutamine amidotransferase